MALSDLIRELAYLKAGGQPQGQRDIDKINQTFSSVGKLGDVGRQYAADTTAQWKNQAELEKTQSETKKNLATASLAGQGKYVNPLNGAISDTPNESWIGPVSNATALTVASRFNAAAAANAPQPVTTRAEAKKSGSVAKGTIILPDPEKPLLEGKTMTAPSIMALNEGKKAYLTLPDVESAVINNKSLFGPVRGRVGQNNPYDTQSQTVDAQMRASSQAFGRFMEGGVLRKEDEEKYRHMFPMLSDTYDVAQNKLKIVQKILADKYESDRIALGKSGYDVSGFEQLGIPKSLFKTQPTSFAPQRSVQEEMAQINQEADEAIKEGKNPILVNKRRQKLISELGKK